MALPDASAGDDVLAGDLADIFGIDLDPADSGAAAARQGTTGRRRPRREAASDRRPAVRVPAYGPPRVHRRGTPRRPDGGRGGSAVADAPASQAKSPEYGVRQAALLALVEA